MKTEAWVDVKGYEGAYQVSSLGRIQSLDRVILKKNNTSRFQKGKIVRPKMNMGGYQTIHFRKNGECHFRTVHRVVMENLTIQNTVKPFVNHINSIKTDNRLENLEWVTPQENMDHMAKNHRSCKGTKNWSAKLDVEKVLAIRTFRKRKDWSQRKLAAVFGVSHSAIGQIFKGQTWTHV